MPIFEYLCSNIECQFQDELLQKISESTIIRCPKCDQDTFQKKTSLPSFHLKGSGWYKDGYDGKKKIDKKVSADIAAADTPKKDNSTTTTNTESSSNSGKKEKKPSNSSSETKVKTNKA